MTTQQHLAMHSDHREAESEIESWIDDIYMWSAEHKQALAWVSQIEAAIHEFDMALQQHRSVIDKLERHIRQHEHEITVQEQKEESRESTILAEQHAQFNQRHTQAQKSHARIGERHRKQIAELHRLQKHFTEVSKTP